MDETTHLISQLTLEEKASLCSGQNFWFLKGVERLGIPAIMVTDGPHGLRKQAGDPSRVGLQDSVPATCFPTASALAATWNRELVYQVGEALGRECRQEKVGVLLGPGANIKRSPLCGRNFEYFSEDPFLSGEMAASHIKGVQSQGIGASLKHFAVNNQEHRRMVIDAIVDQRALREVYLAGFERAVKAAQPWTVMGAYNRLNGVYCCEDPFLLDQVLRKEWGYQGLAVTDWGAMNERVAALQAGLDLEMPGPSRDNQSSIQAAVRSGELDGEDLDQAVDRILNLVLTAERTLAADYRSDPAAHHALARRAAGEGAVLLKNERDSLPLGKDLKIALLGRFAKIPRYQGAGSSLVNPTRLDNLHDELISLLGAARVRYAPGYTESGDHPHQGLIQEALAVCQEADAVVICAGLTDLYETEGLDREHLELPPGHNALIEAAAKIHQRVIVVLSNGAPVEMPWANRVPAILEAYLGGQAGAGAIADILVGITNPSGKLAETFPLKLEDNPSQANFPAGPGTVEYRESLYVGYRYYDTVGLDVLFPFGHGLSYTSYEYSSLELSRTRITDQDALSVTLQVRNTGNRAGKEIVQLYVRDLESTPFRPEKELKAFTKVELQPGERTAVRLELDRRAFAYFDTGQGDWAVEPGEFEILVGASSRDIRLRGVVDVEPADYIPAPERDCLSAYKNIKPGAAFSQADFAALLGRSLPPNRRARKGEFTLNTPVGDMRSTLLGRLLIRYLRGRVSEVMAAERGTPTALLMESMVRELPLRGLLMMGGDSVSREVLEAALVALNGRLIKGIRQLIQLLRSAPDPRD